MEIPDFRDPAVREKYRHDDFVQEHFDPRTALFPEGHDPAITGKFSSVMTKLIQAWQISGTILIRQVYDGMKIFPYLANDTGRMAVIRDVNTLMSQLDDLAEAFREAHTIIDAYPDSLAAKMLLSELAIGEEEKISHPEETRKELSDWLLKIRW